MKLKFGGIFINYLFADRMEHIPRSFVREILKITEDPEMISFAGGLPNPRSFPVDEIAAAASKVLKEMGIKSSNTAPLKDTLLFENILQKDTLRKV